MNCNGHSTLGDAMTSKVKTAAEANLEQTRQHLAAALAHLTRVRRPSQTKEVRS